MSNFDFIHVEGIGNRRHGVSKSGNAYDFIPVHITYDGKPRDGVRGRCAAVCNVDTETVQRINPQPGDDFTVTLSLGSNFGVTISHWVARGHVDLDLL